MFNIFKRKRLFYAERRRLVKWIDADYLAALSAPSVAAIWILASNVWNDSGEWVDTETWND